MKNKIKLSRWLYLVIIAFNVSIISGCSSNVTRQNADWSYAKDAITISFKADKSLNVFDNYPHALTVGIAQVTSPDKYVQMLQTTNGLVSAIANEKKIDGQTAFKRISIQPGESKKVVIDRANKTQYVYLFFGYASQNTQKSNYLVPIPLDGTPQPVSIEVDLGPTYVTSFSHT